MPDYRDLLGLHIYHSLLICIYLVPELIELVLTAQYPQANAECKKLP
jgi:hypothetical protein